MVNKCAVFGCKRGYESEEPQHEDYHEFYFPLDERKSHLLPAWEKFVCRDGWKPSANSVICEFHFEDRLIRKGKTSRLQSDPIERRFSQYRQMSGGRFLVSLREVTNSERIIRCRSLVKADINFWKEDLGSDKQSLDFSALLALLSEHEIEIAKSTLDSSSEEVSTTIAGYVAKKLAKRSNCDSCKSLLIASSMDLAENHYLNFLSRGGLIVPSAKLAEYTSHCFAIMDYSYNIVQAHGVRDVRAAYTQIFDRFSPQIDICCSKHNNWGLKFAAKIVINTFFNNKQTVFSDSVRKDTVVAFQKRQRTK